jgi:transposase-like protein
MKKNKSPYLGYRFPASVIGCAVRGYFRFKLRLRDIEELLLERGVVLMILRNCMFKLSMAFVVYTTSSHSGS